MSEAPTASAAEDSSLLGCDMALIDNKFARFGSIQGF